MELNTEAFKWETVNQFFYSLSKRQAVAKEYGFIHFKDDSHFVKHKEDVELLEAFFEADEKIRQSFLASKADDFFHPNTVIEYTGDDGKVRYGIAGVLLNDDRFHEQEEVFILRISNSLHLLFNQE
jgi:hypothetical protein